MKDYITIHINKKTIKRFFDIVFIIVGLCTLIFLFFIFPSMVSYKMAYEKGSSEGYDKGYSVAVNDTFDSIWNYYEGCGTFINDDEITFTFQDGREVVLEIKDCKNDDSGIFAFSSNLNLRRKE